MSSLRSVAWKCALPEPMFTSAMCSSPSTESVTCAVIEVRRNFWSFANFSWACFLTASVPSMCRNVIVMFIVNRPSFLPNPGGGPGRLLP